MRDTWDCDSADGRNDKLENDWKKKIVRKHPPITSEDVELVPFRLLTPHFLTLPIRLISVASPFVGVAGIVIPKPSSPAQRVS